MKNKKLSRANSQKTREFSNLQESKIEAADPVPSIPVAQSLPQKEASPPPPSAGATTWNWPKRSYRRSKQSYKRSFFKSNRSYKCLIIQHICLIICLKACRQIICHRIISRRIENFQVMSIRRQVHFSADADNKFVNHGSIQARAHSMDAFAENLKRQQENGGFTMQRSSNPLVPGFVKQGDEGVIRVRAFLAICPQATRMTPPQTR